MEVESTASEKYQHNFRNWKADGKEIADLAEQRNLNSCSEDDSERQAGPRLYQMPIQRLGLAFHHCSSPSSVPWLAVREIQTNSFRHNPTAPPLTTTLYSSSCPPGAFPLVLRDWLRAHQKQLRAAGNLTPYGVKLGPEGARD